MSSKEGVVAPVGVECERRECWWCAREGLRCFVGRSHEGLGSGDVVDGGDHAPLDLEVLVNDLHSAF